jgi:hypothetical protein
MPAWLGVASQANGLVTAGVPGSNGGADASGCIGCGYYTWQQAPFDNAQNYATTLGPNALSTLSVLSNAACGTVSNWADGKSATTAGCRQVLIDYLPPVLGGIQQPATITGGQNIGFASNANDNLDLTSYDYSLAYANAGSGTIPANLTIRSPNTEPSQVVGTSFDNVLTTASAVTFTVKNFIRDLSETTAGNAPQNNPTLPGSITGRVYDAANNASNPVNQPLNPVNIPQTNRVDFTAAQPNGGTLQTFAITTPAAATNISNPPAGTTPANPTSVTLTAQAVGSETPTTPFNNPFSVVQFYYLDPGTGEFILIGSAPASTVTDNNTVTQRTFTWSMAWTPPRSLGQVNVTIIAIGVNSLGDALVAQANNNITTTNP